MRSRNIWLAGNVWLFTPASCLLLNQILWTFDLMTHLTWLVEFNWEHSFDCFLIIRAFNINNEGREVISFLQWIKKLTDRQIFCIRLNILLHHGCINIFIVHLITRKVIIFMLWSVFVITYGKKCLLFLLSLYKYEIDLFIFFSVCGKTLLSCYGTS